MLGNELRKKLREHKWLEIMHKDSNPTQTWKRLHNKVIRAIGDLTLLADRLPDDKQKEIISRSNFEILVRSILRQPFWIDPEHDEVDARRIQLAAMFAEHGLSKCINQYKSVIEKNETLSAANVHMLQNAIDVCNQIAFRTQVLERELETKQENFVYLFNWHKVPGGDGNKLKEFLKREFDNMDWIDTAEIEKKENDRTLSISSKERYSKNAPSISISLNDKETNARLSVYDVAGIEQISRDFVAKYNDDDSISIYKKRERTYNKKRKTQSNDDYNTVLSI